MITPKNASPLLIRMPDDLKQWLKTTARDERRNMTAQLLCILEQARADKKADEGQTRAD